MSRSWRFAASIAGGELDAGWHVIGNPMGMPTTSIWTAPRHEPHPELRDDLDIDVAIVGAGITGLTAAILLARAGRSVVVLEGQSIGDGVTGNTTAHLTQVIDKRYAQIESSFGIETARAVARSSNEAITRIEAFANETPGACGFVRLPGYLYVDRNDSEDIRELDEELAAAARAGLDVHDVSVLPVAFGGDVLRALRFDDQAAIDAGLYLATLARLAVEAGARIFESSRVVAIDDVEAVLHLDSGAEVRAKHLFLATHAAPHPHFLQLKVHGYLSYVLAFRADASVAPGLFWDTHDPYRYVRSVTREDGAYVLVGGADHRTGTEHETERNFEELARYAEARWGLRDRASSWSAQVFDSIDGLPFIGHRPSAPRAFYATGFGGNGMTFGTLAASIVSDAILGVKNEWADIYAATRAEPISAVVPFLKENVQVPLHFVQDWIGGHTDVRNVGDIAPGDGAVVRTGDRRLAVYRDPHGDLHAVSPVCTHLGCLVKFNAAESSWDCACHGSRFGVDGRVLSGPATKPLAAKPTPDDVPDVWGEETTR